MRLTMPASRETPRTFVKKMSACLILLHTKTCDKYFVLHIDYVNQASIGPGITSETPRGPAILPNAAGSVRTETKPDEKSWKWQDESTTDFWCEKPDSSGQGQLQLRSLYLRRI